MTKPKTIDRHVDPDMVIYPLRVEKSSYDAALKLGKRLDRTRASILREAIRVYLERKGA